VVIDPAELEYLHERIDQLIAQTAVEVGILNYQRDELRSGGQLSLTQQAERIKLAKNRFWAADHAVGRDRGKLSREPKK
jgi:hypothetical protein